MDSSSRGRLLLVSLAGGGAAIAILSVLTTKYVSDPIELLFGHDINRYIVISLVTWYFVVAVARRILVGAGQRDFTSKIALVWGLSYFSVIIAVLLIWVCWLAAFALGQEDAVTWLKAVIIPTAVCIVLKLIGGAATNSAQLMHIWRERSS